MAPSYGLFDVSDWTALHVYEILERVKPVYTQLLKVSNVEQLNKWEQLSNRFLYDMLHVYCVSLTLINEIQ